MLEEDKDLDLKIKRGDGGPLQALNRRILELEKSQSQLSGTNQKRDNDFKKLTDSLIKDRLQRDDKQREFLYFSTKVNFKKTILLCASFFKVFKKSFPLQNDCAMAEYC